jgi:hypothetical protein
MGMELQRSIGAELKAQNDAIMQKVDQLGGARVGTRQASFHARVPPVFSCTSGRRVVKVGTWESHVFDTVSHLLLLCRR